MSAGLLVAPYPDSLSLRGGSLAHRYMPKMERHIKLALLELDTAPVGGGEGSNQEIGTAKLRPNHTPPIANCAQHRGTTALRRWLGIGIKAKKTNSAPLRDGISCSLFGHQSLSLSSAGTHRVHWPG